MPSPPGKRTEGWSWSPISEALTLPYRSIWAGIVVNTSVFPRKHMLTIWSMLNGIRLVLDAAAGEFSAPPTR